MSGMSGANPPSPEVQELADRMAAGEGIGRWPEGVPSDGACAILVVDNDRTAYLCLAPDHQCARPDRLRLAAAAVLLDFWENGPDEGWVHAYADGTGHLTWLSTPGETARSGRGTIPVSEMPPLD